MWGTNKSERDQPDQRHQGGAERDQPRPGHYQRLQRQQCRGAGATIAGGGQPGLVNSAQGVFSTVGGGYGNRALQSKATVAGGANNTASGGAATVPGGQDNNASGNYSFAAGQSANADKDGCFVWGDSSTFTPTLCGAANRFVARSAGGVVFYTSSNLSTGVQVAANSGTWGSVSDRNAKEHFNTVDIRQILARVAQLPVLTWNYKSQDAGIRHIGPMAQDFYAAFQVGEDDRHITDIDEGGVALAAIKGLNQKLEEAQAQIRRQQAQIEALKQLVCQSQPKAELCK